MKKREEHGLSKEKPLGQGEDEKETDALQDTAALGLNAAHRISIPT